MCRHGPWSRAGCHGRPVTPAESAGPQSIAENVSADGLAAVDAVDSAALLAAFRRIDEAFTLALSIWKWMSPANWLVRSTVPLLRDGGRGWLECGEVLAGPDVSSPC
jgi:hypothetical protein